VPAAPVCPVIAVTVALEISKPVGKMTTNLPLAGTGLAVVKVATATPEAPATKLAGVTSAVLITPAVIATSGTVASVSIAVPALS